VVWDGAVKRLVVVENVYVAYNFSYFAIYLLDLIKNWWIFYEVLTKQKCTVL